MPAPVGHLTPCELEDIKDALREYHGAKEGDRLFTKIRRIDEAMG